MEHLAIDLASRESQICVRTETGEIVEERRIRTVLLPGYLRKKPPSVVVMETCSESFRLADAAQASGHEVRVVPSILVRSLGVGARRIKTDRRDAQVLSEVSTQVELRSVHIPSEESRRRKSMCTMRESLVSARTQLVNCVRGWLRTQGVMTKTGGVDWFPSRVWDHFETGEGTGLPPDVKRMLLSIEELSRQIHEADKELKELAKNDEQCRLLMTAPGVGSVTAMRFVAAVDQVERFNDSHALESYFGLVPGEHSSDSRRQRTSITKAGAPRVRWVLTQAAWSAWRCRPNDPMVQWAKRIEERRGRKVAITALSRKLAGILYAMWRDQKPYDPSRGADRIDPDGVVHLARAR